MEELMLVENPFMGHRAPVRRKNRKGGNKMKKNPVGSITKEWFQGVDAMDAGAALGGLAMTVTIPGLVVKQSTTTTGKLMKLGVSLLSTVGAGFIFRNFSPSAGRMAIAGGLAGTLSQGIGMFTNIQIGGKIGNRGGSPPRRLGESRFIRSQEEDSGVQVSVT